MSKFNQFWETVTPIVTRALEYQDTHPADDIKEAIKNKNAQLWTGKRSVIVTEINGYPQSKKCRIWLAAGDMDELVDEMLPDVEEWSKNEGCSSVIIAGRKGWARVLADKNYKQNYVTLERKLSDG